MSILGHTAVDIRGSALPSAAKSNTSHYQPKAFVCVSVISQCFIDNRQYLQLSNSMVGEFLPIKACWAAHAQ